MHVLMLGWEFPPKHSGGMGRVYYYLIRSLTNKGCRVDAVLPKFNAPEKKPFKNLEIHEVPVIEFASSDYLAELNYVLQYNELMYEYLLDKDLTSIDLIHCHDWLSVPAAIKLKKKLKKPLVLTIHSTEKDRTTRIMKSSKIWNIEKLGIKNADLVIGVSKGVRKDLIKLFNADPKKVKTLYNGIPLEEYEYSKTKNDNNVLFVGRHTDQKGPQYLLLAAKEVIKEIPEAKFYFLGEGHLVNSLEEFSKQLGINKNIVFKGRASDPVLRKYYSKSAVTVVPSIYEPFGIVPLESIASGTPVIVSKNAGVCELLTNEKNALLINPFKTKELSDSIKKLLINKKLRNSLAVNAYKVAKNLSWDSITNQMISLYEQVLA